MVWLAFGWRQPSEAEERVAPVCDFRSVNFIRGVTHANRVQPLAVRIAQAERRSAGLAQSLVALLALVFDVLRRVSEIGIVGLYRIGMPAGPRKHFGAQLQPRRRVLIDRERRIGSFERCVACG